MTADQRGESGQQRTVAELLKQYGGEEPTGGRRRRRATKPDDPASGPPAQRSAPQDADQFYPGHDTAGDQPDPWSSSAGFGADEVSGTGGFDSYGLDDAPERPRDSGFTDPGLLSGSDWGSPSATATGGYPAQPASTGTGSYPAQPATGTGGYPAQPASTGTGSYPAQPATGTGSYPAQSPTGTGSYPAQPASNGASTGAFPVAPGTGGFPARPAGSLPAQAYTGDIYRSGVESPPARPEDSTDFIPRFGQRPGAYPAAEPGGPPTAVSSRAEMLGDHDTAGPATTGPHTAVSSRAEMFGDLGDDEADDGPDGAERDLDESTSSGFLGRRLTRGGAAEQTEARPVGLVDEDVPAGLSERDDPDEVERVGRPTGFKVWLSLIGQWVLGAIGGAALWIGFSYLWLNYPVVALAAAVVATAGLVLLVRAIRRSDDLQTTMLAVLVGLVVTISPAVLQLAGR